MSDPSKNVLPVTAGLTLTASELTDLVAPVVPHAATDPTLPLLNVVRVTVRDGFVLAAATDRYRAAFKRLRPATPPDPGFEALIPKPVLSRIRSIFKAKRGSNPALTLTVDDGDLIVQSSSGLDGTTVGARLAFALPDEVCDYPKIEVLLRQVLEHPAESLAAVNVDPSLLADFRIGQPRLEPLRISAALGRDGQQQWVIQCEDDFVGILMPVLRRGPGEQATDSWLELLDERTPEAGAAA